MCSSDLNSKIHHRIGCDHRGSSDVFLHLRTLVTASLEVKNLTKSYQRKGQPPFVAVKDLSFEVRPGEIFGLLGPNGAGKSTTINCLTGFYPPTSGEVLIEGFNVHQDPKKAKQHLGVCSQEDTLDTDFDVLDQMIRYGTFYRLDRFEIVKIGRAHV